MLSKLFLFALLLTLPFHAMSQMWSNPTVKIENIPTGCITKLYKETDGILQVHEIANDDSFMHTLNLDGIDSFHVLELVEDNDTMKIYFKLLDYDVVPTMGKWNDPEYLNLIFEDIYFKQGCYFLNLIPYANLILYDLSDRKIALHYDAISLNIKMQDILSNPISCESGAEEFTYALNKVALPKSIVFQCAALTENRKDSQSCFEEFYRGYSFSMGNIPEHDDSTQEPFSKMVHGMNPDERENLVLFLPHNKSFRGQSFQIKRHGRSGEQMILTFEDGDYKNAENLKINNFRFVEGKFSCDAKCWSKGLELSGDTILISFDHLINNNMH